MSTEEKLQQAEADLETLIARSHNALPTLVRLAEDQQDWRKDIYAELVNNLMKAIDTARSNKARRQA
jgi:hypothetical protein